MAWHACIWLLHADLMCVVFSMSCFSQVGSTDLAHAIITVEIKVVGVSFTYELYIQDRPFEEARAYWIKNPEF